MNAKVSVLITTYNQAGFIDTAIRSVLNQKVDFPLEIVVGDDCSSDGTREILLKWQKAYPSVFRLLLHERNLGAKGKFNFISSLQSCGGDYVAVLDGDDFWTVPGKLQVQADFLDRNSDYSSCFHNAKFVDADGSDTGILLCDANQRETTRIEDLFEGNPVPSCSAMFRRGLISDFPDWFDDIVIGDWAIHILNAAHGPMRYFPQVMAAYRLHTEAAFSKHPNPKMLEEAICLKETVNRHFKYRYDFYASRGILKDRYALANQFMERGDWRKSKYWAKQCLTTRPLNRHLFWRVKILTRLCLPGIYRAGQRLVRALSRG